MNLGSGTGLLALLFAGAALVMAFQEVRELALVFATVAMGLGVLAIRRDEKNARTLGVISLVIAALSLIGLLT